MSLSSSSTTPTISTNAPRVPEPSSRDTTPIEPSCAKTGVTAENANPATANNGKAFNDFFINYISFDFNSDRLSTYINQSSNKHLLISTSIIIARHYKFHVNLM